MADVCGIRQRVMVSVGVGLLASMFLLGSAHAWPVIRTKPNFKWGITTGPAQVLYDSPGAAFAALQDYYSAANAANPGSIASVSDLRPNPQWPYQTNGQWQEWEWDWQETYPSSPASNTSGTTGSIYIVPVCSNAPGWSTVADPTSTPSQHLWCQLTISNPEPSKHECGAGDPIYPASGISEQTIEDFKSPNGLLRFDRTYRNDGTSFSSVVSHSGFFDYAQPSAQSYGSCVVEPYTDPKGQAGTYCFPLTNTGAADALLWNEDGKLLDFAESGGAYQPSPDGVEQVVKLTDAQGNPSWRVRRENNTFELYNAAGRLDSRTWADGKAVKFHYSDSTTPATIAPWPGLLISETDPFGRSLQLIYDAQGRMTQMTDPNGQLYRYSYDTQSSQCVNAVCDRLTEVQYPDQFVLQYLWNEASYTSSTNQPDSLTGVVEVWPASGSDPGKTVRRESFGYDANGLVLSNYGAVPGDQVVASSHSSSGVTITDALGAQYVQSYSTLFGSTYPTGMSQPGGSGCNASNSASIYDPNTGNLTQRDDFDGHRACYAYDTSRNLETTRIEGLSTSASCASVLPSGSALPTNSRKVSTQWHPDWRLATKVAEPGKLTTNVYNGQPDPFNGSATANCAPNTALLPDNKPIVVLCKKVEQPTTDTDGSQGFSATLDTKVPNRNWTYTYNQYGQVLTAKGPRTDVNDTTTYAYYADTTSSHTMGDLQTVTDPLGHATNYTQYDAYGNVLEQVDANGVATDYTYDLRQRLKTVKVGNQTTSYDYWPTGLLKQVTWPDLSTVAYSYDDAHRLTDVTDSQGNSVHYVLDNAGNRLNEQYKDPQGSLKRELDRAYDALGRVQQTTGRE